MKALRKVLAVMAFVLLVFTGSAHAENWNESSSFSEQSGTMINDSFRKITMLENGDVQLKVLWNRVTKQGIHPPGQFMWKGLEMYAHSYPTLGTAMNGWRAPRSVANGDFQDRLPATFTFKNSRDKSSSFIMGVNFSTLPVGKLDPNAYWGIMEWACGGRGEKNTMLFQKGDKFEIRFKVVENKVSTAIAESLADGWVFPDQI
ncbi:hypothetical protein ISS03_00805 [Patescibacteria group bacterium]|nr:hypothetical protein [Patescibacteria group bacterium]